MHSVYIFSQSKSVLFTFVGHSSVEAAKKERVAAWSKKKHRLLCMCVMLMVFFRNRTSTHILIIHKCTNSSIQCYRQQNNIHLLSNSNLTSIDMPCNSKIKRKNLHNSSTTLFYNENCLLLCKYYIYVASQYFFLEYISKHYFFLRVFITQI